MGAIGSTQTSMSNGPAIILVEPQLGENIGSAARAMLNCGLDDLRLVRPRDGWPNPQSRAAASGADEVLDRASVFDHTSDAIADLEAVYASSARPRDMVKPVVTPREAVEEMLRSSPDGSGCGVLFGPERTGLQNDDVALAGALLSAPLNPGFSSLNLAQAVLLVAYEWQVGRMAPVERFLPHRDSRPATVGELENFFDHLVKQLDAGGFLRPPEKRPIMVRNIRNIFTRANLSEQEVRTLHGVVASLASQRRAPREPS